MLSLDLSGKIALFTGASGDLDRVMSRTLVGSGADLEDWLAGNTKRGGAFHPLVAW